MCDKVAVIDSGKVVKIEEITKQEEKIETVEIKVKDIEKAMQIINEKFNDLDTKQDGNSIEITLPTDKLPNVVKELAIADTDIKAVIPKEHSLEDIFFDATKGGKDNENI